MDHAPLLLQVIDVMAGPALILDGQLRIVDATPAAEALLGTVRLGTAATALLCGDRPKRPVAEALAEGRSVEAVVPLPNDTKRLIRVRSIPLPVDGVARTQKPPGWVLLLEDAGAAGDDAVEFHGMWTTDQGMRSVFRMIERIADDDVTVLIRGESGTGKELVAQALHQASFRRKHPFQAVNCAALPPTLLEAELFGTVKGAFTGAHKDTPGLIRSAHRGTLFLDEVAEIPLELQAKLLRVLETKEVQPLGGHEAVKVDVRILSATHRALRREVEAGRFRADLMYRLRVVPLFLPPLRERPGDVVLLARRFLEELNDRGSRRRIEAIAPASLDILRAWTWPGNVRELKNVLQFAMAMGDGPILTPGELPPELLESPRPKHRDVDTLPSTSTAAARPALKDTAAPDRGLIEAALTEANGNRDDAARALGVSRVTLWRWMKDVGMSVRNRRQREQR